MPTRRDFLFGTVAAAAAGTALTIVGKDMKLFAPTLNEIVAVNRISPLNQPGASLIGHMPEFYPAGPGDTLFNKDGLPICVINDLRISQEPLETWFIGEDTPRYMPGLKEVELGVTYIGGPITVTQPEKKRG